MLNSSEFFNVSIVGHVLDLNADLTKMHHPPYSPDLEPSVCHLFSNLTDTILTEICVVIKVVSE